MKQNQEGGKVYMSNYSANFSFHLKALREKRNLTQKAFAELIQYSEKTVSKWECGSSVPCIDTLFDISKILHTSIETLFSERYIYYLGIDGGGTKTELALADKNGNIIRTLKTEPCNPVDIGLNASTVILEDAIYKICSDISFSSIYCFAGIAGGITNDMQQMLKAFFSKFNFLGFSNDSDNKNIIAAGLGDCDGITLILGTGICAYIQKNKKHRRISGWGYLIDNGGSGYNLGRDALNAYFSAVDETGPKTALTEVINEMYPEGMQKLIEYIYSGGKKTVASFAPAIFSALGKNDDTAKKILKQNMNTAAHIIETAAYEFNEKRIPVILAGGLTNQRCVIECLKISLKNPEQFDIKVLDCAPVCGAILLAQQLAKRSESNV